MMDFRRSVLAISGSRATTIQTAALDQRDTENGFQLLQRLRDGRLAERQRLRRDDR
jgi:hypothetical protein